MRLAHGTRIPAEAVIVGVGITPNAQLAEMANDTNQAIVRSARTVDPGRPPNLDVPLEEFLD